MAKNQHNAGLHYRPLNQLGLSNFNDYIENPIDSRFKFNPPPLKCGKLFGLCKADRQKEKLQKHCPWHPLLKMKAYVKWSIADLPILPERWQYLVSASTKKQFGILQKLMDRPDVDSIVCATDAG